METLYTLVIGVAVTLWFLRRHLRRVKTQQERANRVVASASEHVVSPLAQHPLVDSIRCIGCATCTTACPEGDVLGMVGGKAAVVNGAKCIGHGLCADACPIGAISMVTATASMRADLPLLTAEFETSVHNLFIAGELSGLALIKNATQQGRACVDTIASRLASSDARRSAGVHDVLIVGAGPAGISASLRAIERQLDYLTIERGDIGGTVAHYPRQKLVLTSPVDLPLYGRLRQTEFSKEALLALWTSVLDKANCQVQTQETVEQVQAGPDGMFTITTSRRTCRARAVVLALGRSGNPRQLGVPGEQLPKVMYRLIDADRYRDQRILIVGGGDSAVEAALGLAHQPGNRVTLSYRGSAFGRIKERNRIRLLEAATRGGLSILLNSHLVEVDAGAVLLAVGGDTRRLENDLVWIMAGGEPPQAFLERCGIAFGSRDLTVDRNRELQLV